MRINQQKTVGYFHQPERVSVRFQQVCSHLPLALPIRQCSRDWRSRDWCLWFAYPHTSPETAAATLGALSLDLASGSTF